MNVTTRIRIERRIVRKIVNDAIARSYTLSVHDGEAVTIHRSRNPAKVMAALFTTDDDTLFVYDGSIQLGWVSLVYGNDGFDVIQDYACKIAHVVAGAEQLANKLEEQYA